LHNEIYERLIENAKKQNLRFSAQFMQDKMAYLFFEGKKDGFYIEIGANDGYNGSTTFWAQQLGWKGICVEPQKTTFERLQKYRNCALYNFAISDKTQKNVEFIAFPERDFRSGISNTMSQQHIEDAKKLSNMQTTTIDTITFDDMMKDFPDIKHIDFLSIDTEGHEINVLQSIDFDKYSFGFITIETEENSDVVEFIKQKGYKMLLTAGNDVIFAPKTFQIKQICCIYPFDCDNKYIDLMKTMLQLINIEPVPQKYMDIADYVWYHWIENSYEDPNILQQIKSLATTGKKIIWNFHNKIPHETKDVQKATDFMRTMANIAYKIIIHSNATVKVIEELCSSEPNVLSKIVFVPHPYYTGAYGFEKSQNNLQNEKLKLCFLGRIKKYKNIEILISAIKELNFDDVELNIYGSGDGQYLQSLNGLIGEYGNIKTDFKFVDDKEIPEILANCHLFVLPYNLDSLLNSGATLLALSYGRSVLSPLTGTLEDIEDKAMFFAYSYKEQREHKEELKRQIIAIREKYRGNYNELLNLGKKCTQYVSENNSFMRVTESLAQVF
jgi:FkbM family methyltransferase